MKSARQIATPEALCVLAREEALTCQIFLFRIEGVQRLSDLFLVRTEVERPYVSVGSQQRFNRASRLSQRSRATKHVAYNPVIRGRVERDRQYRCFGGGKGMQARIAQDRRSAPLNSGPDGDISLQNSQPRMDCGTTRSSHVSARLFLPGPFRLPSLLRAQTDGDRESNDRTKELRPSGLTVVGVHPTANVSDCADIQHQPDAAPIPALALP